VIARKRGSRLVGAGSGRALAQTAVRSDGNRAERGHDLDAGGSMDGAASFDF